MTVFLRLVLGGVVMSAIALVGSVTLVLHESTLQKVLLPLVAFAAGSMIGGALFHMLPASLVNLSPLTTFAWVATGFALFFALEQFLHWHPRHRASATRRKPLTYLVLAGDGLHNFLGGLAIASVFLVDVRLGIAAWLAAAAHEVPRELGDFAVLIHGGWKKRSALLFNLLSGSTHSRRSATEHRSPAAAGEWPPCCKCGYSFTKRRQDFGARSERPPPLLPIPLHSSTYSDRTRAACPRHSSSAGA
ncbi:MAG: hypothetical protein RL685_4518 [Pseudomonadota bacterium]